MTTFIFPVVQRNSDEDFYVNQHHLAKQAASEDFKCLQNLHLTCPPIKLFPIRSDWFHISLAN